jgi:hypothetical protein
VPILSQVLGKKYDGSHTGTNGIIRTEVRIDSTLDVVSGDIFFLYKDRSSGVTQELQEFMYSFICLDLEIKNTDPVIVRGRMDFFRYTTLEGTMELKVNNDLINATLQFKNRLTNIKPTTATIELRRHSPFFREMELETDFMEGTNMPPIYNTHSVTTRPPDLNKEDISIKSFYAKAGINILESKKSNMIHVDPNDTWDERELHNLMIGNMFRFQDTSGWRLYLLIATQYVEPRVAGIMFDSTDEFPRQGCAVFTKHRRIDGDSPEHKRYYFFAACHEMGHAFNLYHSFHKGLSGPFEFPRPDSLSIMNYPQYYPMGPNAPDEFDGSERFWSKFMFSFDEGELLHIRHHDLLEVMMAGNVFGSEGHMNEHIFTNLDSSMISPAKSFELMLRSQKEVFEYGEPVLLEAKLQNSSSKPVSIRSSIEESFEDGVFHPSILNVKDNAIRVSIGSQEGISKPYSPMVIRCGEDDAITLSPGQSIYENIYLSYGKEGFYFKNPGRYKVQASIPSFNGILKSNTYEFAVAEPQSLTENKYINSIFTQDKGQWLYLKGADHLLNAETDLLSLKNRIEDTNLARYIQLYKGSRLSRSFKSVVGNKVTKRDQIKKQALQELESSIAPTRSEEIPFNNILLNDIMNKIADIQKNLGKFTDAKDTISKQIDYLKGRKAASFVLARLEQKYDNIRKSKTIDKVSKKK